jgi:hypothetical protein
MRYEKKDSKKTQPQAKQPLRYAKNCMQKYEV